MSTESEDNAFSSFAKVVALSAAVIAIIAGMVACEKDRNRHIEEMRRIEIGATNLVEKL